MKNWNRNNKKKKNTYKKELQHIHNKPKNNNHTHTHTHTHTQLSQANNPIQKRLISLNTINDKRFGPTILKTVATQ